jgi:dienelactone hydrolase
MTTLFELAAKLLAAIPALVFAASAGLAQSGAKTATLPAPTGQYGVGVYAQTISDATRREIFTKDPNDVRRLPVRVYYPVRKGTCAPRLYLPEALGVSYAAEIGLAAGFERSALAHSCPDARIVSGSSRFPVIMFSHGLRHTHFSYLSIIEDLVSHGNIVVAVDHTHAAPATHFPDGPAVPQDNSLWRRGEDPVQFRQAMLEYPRWWAEDTRRVLDAVTSKEATPIQRGIRGRIDPDRILYIGHSYGGMAAVYASKFDMRLKGAVNLDGLIAGRYPLPVTSDVPLLVLNAEDRNETKTYMETARVLPVKRAHQMTFSDYVWLLENFDAKGRKAPEGSPTGTENIQMTREVLRLFADCAFERRCQPLDAKLATIRAPLPPIGATPAEAAGSAAPPPTERTSGS